MKELINKLRYKYYSRYYKDFPKDIITTIKNISKPVLIFCSRRNGKTYTAVKYQYIHYVENYRFKEAKIILKNYKNYFR